MPIWLESGSVASTGQRSGISKRCSRELTRYPITMDFHLRLLRCSYLRLCVVTVRAFKASLLKSRFAMIILGEIATSTAGFEMLRVVSLYKEEAAAIA